MTDASWGKVWHHLKGFPCDRNVSLNLFREQTNSLFALAQKFTEEILSTKEVFHFFCFWTGKLRLGILGCLWSWYDPNFKKVSFTKYIEFCLQIWRRMVRNLSKLNSGKIQKCYQIVFLPKMYSYTTIFQAQLTQCSTFHNGLWIWFFYFLLSKEPKYYFIFSIERLWNAVCIRYAWATNHWKMLPFSAAKKVEKRCFSVFCQLGP